MKNRFQPGADCPLVLMALEEHCAALTAVIRAMKNDLMADRSTPSPENAARRSRIKEHADNITGAARRLLEDWCD